MLVLTADGHGFNESDTIEVHFCSDLLLDVRVVSPRLITGTTSPSTVSPGPCDVSIVRVSGNIVLALAPNAVTLRNSAELPTGGGNFIDWLLPINEHTNAAPVTCVEYPFSSNAWCAQDPAGACCFTVVEHSCRVPVPTVLY